MKPNNPFFLLLLCCLPTAVAGADSRAWELVYMEEEQGIEPYLSRISITGTHLRIDDIGDDSGYILYDHADRVIRSVSHYNRLILVIDLHAYTRPEPAGKLVTTDSAMPDAPRIAGKVVNDYRVEHETDAGAETCTHIQYVPGLLSGAGAMLHAYQQVMAGNQARTLAQTPPEYQTPCMLSDQVYFDGEIYSRGLPVMEWHSNGKSRYLQNYREAEFDAGLFTLPEDYRIIRLHQAGQGDAPQRQPSAP